MEGEVKRCVIAAPTVGWARKVYPHLTPQAAFDSLAGVVRAVCHLDEPDPQASFLEEHRLLEMRRERLKSLDIRSLRFLDDETGTDFSVALTEHSKWLGGVKRTNSGELFYANVPIGELFSTADFRSANGIVAATMPSKFNSVTVRDLVLTFVDGAVSDFTCEDGKQELMRAFFADVKLRRIGEIALASIASALGRNECFFDVILYDEKMRAHLAVGEAYLTCLNDAAELLRKVELGEITWEDLGINYPAPKHVDLMISRASTRAWGIDGSRRQHLLIEAGDWGEALR